MPDSIDDLQAIADVYASAMLAVAQERGSVHQVRSELEELVQLQQSDPDFAAFMTSTAIDPDRRGQSLERMFRGKTSDETLNTLLVMNRNGRSGLLPYLLQQYTTRRQQAAGEVVVAAVSAVELSPHEQETITAIAAAISGRTPVMTFQVDPEIIGGLILQVGDLRYDNSVVGQLKTARSRLLERSERGIQVGIENG